MTDPTIIRAATLVQGNLTGEDPVEVEGQLIGQVRLSNTLTVQPGGLVRGQLHVHQAIILGRVEGAITASERIYLGPQAVVVADLDCPVIRVDDGAKLHGKLLMPLEGAAKSVAPLQLPVQQDAPAKPATTKPAWGAQPTSFTSPAKPAPVAAPVAQPAVEQVVETVVQQATKPVAQPVVEQVVQPISFTSTRPASAQHTSSATQATTTPAATTTTVVEAAPIEVVEQVEVVEAVEVVEQVEPEAIVEVIPATTQSVEEDTVAVEEPEDEPDDERDEEAEQRMIDEAAKYEHHTVKELREELRRLDLPVSGSKEDLIERLINAAP